MARILTPENFVRRIAAECTFVDERGAVGIRLKPAAAIVRQYGSNSAHSGVGADRGRRNHRLYGERRAAHISVLENRVVAYNRFGTCLRRVSLRVAPWLLLGLAD